jgi:hypothetical protein
MGAVSVRKRCSVKSFAFPPTDVFMDDDYRQ